ncbi:MAG: signal recognition particle-docking protein FtsY [Burkholderiales bacterium]
MLGLFKKSDSEQKTVAWFERLKLGLKKTRSQLAGLFAGGIDESLFEQLETALLASDTGVEATQYLLSGLRRCALRAENAEQLKAELQAMLVELLEPLEQPFDVTRAKPFIIMLAGVNGAGKTTSIGKLARYFQNRGLSVLLAAGDTFRAAAREQLVAWGERSGVAVISQAGGDPGAVVFDAVQAARARSIDVVLADTAGRLQTQLHLMEEAKKIKRVIAKAEAGAPHEIWLVLDANTGQNALNQVKVFDEALGLTGLVLTKLDGTAKGGVVCAIARARSKDPRQRPVPLRFIGVGEGIDDLRPFVAREFVAALLS